MDLAPQVFYQIFTVFNPSLKINHVTLKNCDLVVAMADGFNIFIILQPEVIQSFPYMTNFWTTALCELVKLKTNPIALSVAVRSSLRFLLETSSYLNVLRVFQSEIINLLPQLLVLPIELVLISLLSIDRNIKISNFLSEFSLHWIRLVKLFSKLVI